MTTKTETERLTRSARLLENPLPYGHPLYDQLFTVGEVTRKGSTITIDIDDNTPTVTFPDKVAEIQNATGVKILSVIGMKKGEEDPRYTGLSGGGFLWFKREGQEDAVALLQRQIYAKDNPALGKVVAPGQYICASGRADGLLSQVCEAETAQEIFTLLAKPGQPFAPVMYTFNGRPAMAEIEMAARFGELRQAEEKIGIAPENRLPAPLLPPVAMNVIDRTADAPFTATIVTRINGKTVDEYKAIPFFESAARMLQTNRSLEIAIPSGFELKLYNGEGAGRPVRLMTAADMVAEDRRHELALKTDPEDVGGIFTMVSGAYVRRVQDDLPQLRNAQGIVEGNYGEIQRQLTAARTQAAPAPTTPRLG